MVLKKQDLFLIAFFLCLAAVLLFCFNRTTGTGVAVVEQNGTELYRFDLGKQKTAQIIDLGGEYHVKLLLEPGAISFQHSNCRDQICVRTGKLSKPGQAAVCLPAKISVRIAEDKKNFDGFTG